MGSSASRPQALLTRPNEDQASNSSSSHSPYSYSYSDSPSTSIFRSLSLPTRLVHHPPLRKGDTDHLVSLTSTTYGSLVLVDPTPIPTPNPNPVTNLNGQVPANSSVHIAKTLTPSDPTDPSSLDSMINTWELVEGIDDFDFHIIHSTIDSPKEPGTNSCADCNGSFGKALDAFKMVKSYEIVEHSDSKPLWKHLSEESLLAKMDPNVASSYRKALSSRQLGYKDPKEAKTQTIQSVDSGVASSVLPSGHYYLKGTEDRIVLYYTSLRGIRKTYEACCEVRMIFKGFRVSVDERDISMDSSYRNELQSAFERKVVTLPQVFIRGKHIGGADEIKQLHEAGELAKLLQGLPVKEPKLFCGSCGDARFVLCPTCNGSQKVFVEEEARLRRCPDCNENGLIRCPSCCG